MGNRGRTSTAETTVTTLAKIESIERPNPPDELTDEQAGEWIKIVDRMEAGWFQAETSPMLVERCFHVCRGRKLEILAIKAEQKKRFDIYEYDKIAHAIERETRAISSLCTRMRLTQQSSYDKSKKKPASIEAPWSAARKRSRHHRV